MLRSFRGGFRLRSPAMAGTIQQWAAREMPPEGRGDEAAAHEIRIQAHLGGRSPLHAVHHRVQSCSPKPSLIPRITPDRRPHPRASRSHPSSASVDADIAAMTHTGKIRTNNEDNFLVVRFGRFLQTMLTSLSEDHQIPDHSLSGYGMAVADGMGGMAAGEVASRLALTVLVNLVLETPDWMLSHDEPHLEKVIARAIRRFGRVNQTVLEEARRQPSLKGMGTTLTMACSLGVNMLIAHVGDSPVYMLRQGGLHRLTRDHTVAQQMAEHGPFPSNALPPRYRHVLTQAIGVRDTRERARHPAIVARGRRPTAALQRRTDRHGGRSDDRHAPEEQREQRRRRARPSSTRPSSAGAGITSRSSSRRTGSLPEREVRRADAVVAEAGSTIEHTKPRG